MCKLTWGGGMPVVSFAQLRYAQKSLMKQLACRHISATNLREEKYVRLRRVLEALSFATLRNRS